MIKYNVSVNWLDFEFTDAFEATQFARLAAKHLKKDSPRVSIDFEFTEEEDVEEDEEEEEYEADEENS